MASTLRVGTFVTVDGVMQAPGGRGEDPSGGFSLGGWLAPHVDEGFGEIMGPLLSGADAMLLGRRSYDIMAAHWPNVPDDEGGALINGMVKYVATRTSFPAEWSNTTVLAGEAAETVAALKRDTDGTILVQGSSDLLRTLQDAELVDEYHLLIFPVVVGVGKRLFREGTAPAGLRLIESRTTPAGVIYAAYAHDGPPKIRDVA